MPPRIRKSKPASTDASSATPSKTAESTAHATAPPSTAQAATATLPIVYLDMPPATANIPAPTAGFVAGDSADYRAVLPRDAELRALPIAVKDMARFTNYTQIFGETAPPYAQVLQALTVANAWSSMRTDTAAWDVFCGVQEGISWTTVRAQMARLQPSFELAKGGTSNVATLYPGLATLLNAKQVIAKKGASTRKMNKEANAKGEAQTHGKVGKKRQKAAEKAAYAAATTAPAPAAAAAAPASSVAQPAPVAPAGAVAAPVASPSNGATNGTPHS